MTYAIAYAVVAGVSYEVLTRTPAALIFRHVRITVACLAVMLFANNVLRVEDVYALIGAAPWLVTAISWVNAILGGIVAAFALVLFFPTVWEIAQDLRVIRTALAMKEISLDRVDGVLATTITLTSRLRGGDKYPAQAGGASPTFVTTASPGPVVKHGEGDFVWYVNAPNGAKAGSDRQSITVVPVVTNPGRLCPAEYLINADSAAVGGPTTTSVAIRSGITTEDVKSLVSQGLGVITSLGGLIGFARIAFGRSKTAESVVQRALE